MVNLRDLTARRAGIKVVLSNLKSQLDGGPNAEVSREAGLELIQKAKNFGLSIPNYLRLAIDLNACEDGQKFAKAGLDGYEAALAFLDLPYKNDLGKGVCLAQASETFTTYPGTRILFQPVVDEILRFSTRQDQVEKISEIVGSSRTIRGTEMISIVADSDQEAEQNYSVAEGGGIPVRKIRTRELAVRMFKHGLGYEFTYEFGRNASIDIFLPYAARIDRALELDKVRAATSVMVNGDGVNPAAPVVTQSSQLVGSGETNTPGRIVYRGLLNWILGRAKAGAPIDTVIGNYDTYLEWLRLFTPTLNSMSEAEATAKVGGPNLTANIPGLFVPIRFAISSAMPAGQLLGFVKAETLQELIEEGSQIAESEKAIRNQIVTFVKSETTGYKLIFGDTRSIYNMAA